jgi:hypothetical protein
MKITDRETGNRKVQNTNYKAFRSHMINAIKNTGATKEELEVLFTKYDKKMERFHINGLISDQHLGKLDALLFDITENILYAN